jgi:hypothetical protein
MTTPMTMKETFPRVLRFTGDTPKPHVARRTATGVVALSGGQYSSKVFIVGGVAPTYLEHLDESHTEVEVRLVTADQAGAEEEADGHNSAEVYAARHGDLFPRVEDGGEAGEELGHEGGKDQMPCCEEDGELCKRQSVHVWMAPPVLGAQKGTDETLLCRECIC